MSDDDAEINNLIKQVDACSFSDRCLDEKIARALGWRIAATTKGPHIMREGSVCSWNLPAYTCSSKNRANAIRQLRFKRTT